MTVTVTGANDAPVAVDDVATTPEDTAVAIAAATLLANDTDLDGDTLSVTAVGTAVNGTVSLVGSTITFTPAANYTGVASFEYTVSDGALTDTGVVTVTVTAVNDGPTATPQSVSTPEDTALGITLAGTDPENDTLTFAVATGPTNGVLSGTAPNLTYTPNANVTGGDSFTFTVSDGTTTSAPATVTIAVTPANDPPVAVDDAAATTEDVAVVIAAATLLANDTDADNDPLSVTAVANAINGTVSLVGSDITFTPIGELQRDRHLRIHGE